MRKKIVILCSILAAGCLFSGCGKNEQKETEAALETFADNQTDTKTVTSENGTVQFSNETADDEEFDFGYKAEDYVSVGDYSGVKVTKTEPEAVTDEDIQSDIENRLKTHDMWNEKKEGTVEQFDLVNMDFTGTVDGKTFQNSTGTDINIRVGSGDYCKEVEAQIIGKNIGDKITFKVTMPDDSKFSDAAGKEAEYTVTVKAVRTLPDITDDVINKLTDGKYKTVSDYETYIRQVLQKEKEIKNNLTIFEETLGQVADTFEFKGVPEQEKEGDIDIETIRKEAEEKGVEPVELVNQYEAEGKTVAYEQSTNSKIDLLILYVAQKEGITVTGADIKALKAELIEWNAFKDEEDIAENLSERQLAHAALREKVCAYIAQKAE